VHALEPRRVRAAANRWRMEIPRELVEGDQVDCIVVMPDKRYNVAIRVTPPTYSMPVDVNLQCRCGAAKRLP
jgi:hypothetical protein